MTFLEEYKYPIIGGIIGAFLTILIFTIGFWKIVLLLILIVIGALVGYYIQKSGIIEHLKNK